MSRVTIPQLQNLIGNKKVHARQKPDGKWYLVEKPITVADLKQHIAGEITLGTYVVTGDQAKTLVFDIDREYSDAAFDLLDALIDLGLPPERNAVEFSGNKGYHVWVVLGSPVPARDLRRVGRAALALADVECEVFPKQDQVKNYGNLVKLPGGVHQVTGKRNDFVTDPPKPISVQVFNDVVAKLPAEPVATSSFGRDPFPCLGRIAKGVPKGNRNNSLYHYAAMLRRGGVPDEVVAAAVHQAALNAEDGDELYDEVNNILESTAQSAGPLCHSLDDDIKCDPDECVCRYDSKLFLKAGQLRHGAPGEKAVVKLKMRYDDKRIVEIEHPDGVGKLQLHEST